MTIVFLAAILLPCSAQDRRKLHTEENGFQWYECIKYNRRMSIDWAESLDGRKLTGVLDFRKKPKSLHVGYILSENDKNKGLLYECARYNLDKRDELDLYIYDEQGIRHNLHNINFINCIMYVEGSYYLLCQDLNFGQHLLKLSSYAKEIASFKAANKCAVLDDLFYIYFTPSHCDNEIGDLYDLNGNNVLGGVQFKQTNGGMQIVSGYEGQGLLDKSNKWIIRPNQGVDKIEELNENLFGVSSKNHKGILTEKGEWIVNLNENVTKIEKLKTGVFVVSKGDTQGLISQTGQWIVDLNNQYSIISVLGDYYKVVRQGKQGLITKTGVEIIPTECADLDYIGNGLFKFRASNDGFWGVINTSGKTIIPTTRGYTHIGEFSKLTKTIPYNMTGYKGECNEFGKQLSRIKVKEAAVASSSSSSRSNKSTITLPFANGSYDVLQVNSHFNGNCITIEIEGNITIADNIININIPANINLKNKTFNIIKNSQKKKIFGAPQRNYSIYQTSNGDEIGLYIDSSFSSIGIIERKLLITLNNSTSFEVVF